MQNWYFCYHISAFSQENLIFSLKSIIIFENLRFLNIDVASKIEHFGSNSIVLLLWINCLALINTGTINCVNKFQSCFCDWNSWLFQNELIMRCLGPGEWRKCGKSLNTNSIALHYCTRVGQGNLRGNDNQC